MSTIKQCLYYIFSDVNSVHYICDKDDNIYEGTIEEIMTYDDYIKINIEFYGGTELFQFRDDFTRWTREISRYECRNHENRIFRINIKKSMSLNSAIMITVRNFCGSDIKALTDPVNRDEFEVMEQCFNAGLMTCASDINEPCDVYGYDFTSEYPNALCKCIIPVNVGKKVVFDSLPEKLTFGIYRVRITYNNPNFSKVFSFSRTHHYTSRQLRALRDHQELFQLEFELLPPDDEFDYNAYVYEGKFLELKTVFEKYVNTMKEIRKQCSKDNKLIKMMLSSCWGASVETNKIKVDIDSPEYEEMTFRSKTYHDLGPVKGTNKNAFVRYDNISKYNGFYRIKTFLTTNVRTFMMNYAVKNNIINDILRIHTDSFMLRKEKKFNQKENKDIVPIPEQKSTGFIRIYNVHRYKHVCKCCNVEYEFKTGHECT